MLVLSVTEMETRVEVGIGSFVDESSKEVSGREGAVGATVSLGNPKILGGSWRRHNFCTQPKTEKPLCKIQSLLSDAINHFFHWSFSVHIFFRELSRETLYCVPKVRQHRGIRTPTNHVVDLRSAGSFSFTAGRQPRKLQIATRRHKHQSLLHLPSITTSTKHPSSSTLLD
jgi:hypothetical protein